MRCYTITIPNLPDPMKDPRVAAEVSDFLGEQKGLLGIHPVAPNGTILVFDTIENARFSLSRFTELGNQCSSCIMNAELSSDRRELNIQSIAERNDNIPLQ